MNHHTATFAGGCFWCLEAVFIRLKGVQAVVSGYTGGTVPDPTYEDVSSGTTGHAEAVQIEFDPAVISYSQLLDVFFALHDPTTKDRQGNDIGTQYRSAIFCHTDEQQQAAEAKLLALEQAKTYAGPIVTELQPATLFYPAEAHHQHFYDNNRQYGYCNLVIDPKIKKLYKDFTELALPAQSTM